jgi:hypothetical protein
MNPRELVSYIRSGPTELVLHEPLRFRRRTLFNWCDFSDFLHALQSSKTIRTVWCRSQHKLGITEDEWVLLIKTLGSIKGIENLILHCVSGSHDFHPFQAVADAVNNAHSLYSLMVVVDWRTFPRDPSGLIALGNALRAHTPLQKFTWVDICSRTEATQITALDPVLRALSTCPHLWLVSIMTSYASADAKKNLLQLQSATLLSLVLDAEECLAVTDEIRRGRCNVKKLTFVMRTESDATETVKAVASAIQMDRNMESLHLQMWHGFTDEAGVALAETLTVNTTLRNITLAVRPASTGNPLPNADAYGAPVYEAFASMLCRNTSLNLVLPPFCSTGGDQSHAQMLIEQRTSRTRRCLSSND